jgi:ribosomal protein S1
VETELSQNIHILVAQPIFRTSLMSFLDTTHQLIRRFIASESAPNTLPEEPPATLVAIDTPSHSGASPEIGSAGTGNDGDNFPAGDWHDSGEDFKRQWSDEEKKAIREKRAEMRKSTAYAPGEEHMATITGIQYFGIFVEMPNGEPALAVKYEVQPPGDEPVRYQMGQRVQVLVMDFVAETGLKVSIARCRNPYRYNRLTAYEADAIVEGVVAAEVELGHIVSLPNGEYGLMRRSLYVPLGEVPPCDVGDKVRVKLLEFKPNKGWRMSEIEARRQPPLINRDDIDKSAGVMAHVEKVFESAIIVRLPDGAWGRVPRPEWVPDEVYEVGDVVRVVPIRRSADVHWRYSLKDIAISWEDWMRDNPVGTILSGRITSVADYGIHVVIREGIHGVLLTHKMFIAMRNYKKSGFDASHVGQTIKVCVDRLSPEEGRRMSFRMVFPFQEGDIVTGTVAVIARQGLYLNMGPGVQYLWSERSIQHHLGMDPRQAAAAHETFRMVVKKRSADSDNYMFDWLPE